MNAITCTKLILVEGKDEYEFLKVYLSYLNINQVDILNIEGKDNFGKKLKAIVNSSGFDSVQKLLLIRDADFGKNANDNAFFSLQNALKDAGLSFPKVINQFSQTNTSSLQTAIYIMPFAEWEGMFEDLLLATISENHQKCIQQFVECMNISIPLHKLPKAKVQAYLAAQDEPKRDFIGSLKDNAHQYWNLNHHRLNDLKQVLLEMNL